jgi:hypothetical protein
VGAREMGRLGREGGSMGAREREKDWAGNGLVEGGFLFLFLFLFLLSPFSVEQLFSYIFLSAKKIYFK